MDYRLRVCPVVQQMGKKLSPARGQPALFYFLFYTPLLMKEISSTLRSYARPDKAAFLPTFFKTGPGQYGEGDQFIGVMVPDCRKVALKFLHAEMKQLEPLLESKTHEERLVALLILVEKFKKAKTEKEQNAVVKFYLDHLQGVNNWDLVDLTADKILGSYLLNKKRSLLYEFALSNNLWKRRMAVVSTFAFIRNNQFADTFKLCEQLMNDKHDLMHKACGWMLRETGKRDEKALELFLHAHYKKMPRTMLRYAIERLPERKRKAYLNGTM